MQFDNVVNYNIPYIFKLQLYFNNYLLNFKGIWNNSQIRHERTIYPDKFHKGIITEQKYCSCIKMGKRKSITVKCSGI